MDQERSRRRYECRHDPARVLTLTDGAFAIVITLLVLKIHVPELAGGKPLGDALGELIALTRLAAWLYATNRPHLVFEPIDRRTMTVGVLIVAVPAPSTCSPSCSRNPHRWPAW
jgi:hypothetical protein